MNGIIEVALALAITLCMSICGSSEDRVTVCRTYNPDKESGTPKCEGETVTIVNTGSPDGGIESLDKSKEEQIKEIAQQVVEEYIGNFTTRLNRLSEKIDQAIQTEISKKSQNCDDLYKHGLTTDGAYNISVNRQVMEVYCEFQRNGSNWMIFQKRFSGEVDFYRNWTDYVEGFGEKYGEFWFGLKDLHSILSTGRHMLRVDIEDWEGNTVYAEYRMFSIGNESTNYTSTIEGYSGNAGDSLSYHNNRQFSTKDRENDIASIHCSTTWFGGWWYKNCYYANLNGKYLRDGTISRTGMTWYYWKNSYYSLKKSEMKIRPVQQ